MKALNLARKLGTQVLALGLGLVYSNLGGIQFQQELVYVFGTDRTVWPVSHLLDCFAHRRKLLLKFLFSSELSLQTSDFN